MSTRTILFGAGVVFALYGLFCIWFYFSLNLVIDVPLAQLLKLVGEGSLIGGLVMILVPVFMRAFEWILKRPPSSDRSHKGKVRG